ncbi:MAG TPA: hypothetical protein VIJ94_15965 [Caulobacteraceae bacterium]
MNRDIERFVHLERELLHERFAHFERAVLQDNIVLCDAKSGVLLAFGGAMVIFCIDAFVGGHSPHAGALHMAANSLFLISAAAFLVSCHFSLTTVLPRLRRGREDHIFWEAPVFDLPVESYIEIMEELDAVKERRDKLAHLHMLAGICRTKFSHFQIAIRSAQAAFALLVAAELARLIG